MFVPKDRLLLQERERNHIQPSFHQYHILTPSSKLFSTEAQRGKA